MGAFLLINIILKMAKSGFGDLFELYSDNYIFLYKMATFITANCTGDKLYKLQVRLLLECHGTSLLISFPDSQVTQLGFCQHGNKLNMQISVVWWSFSGFVCLFVYFGSEKKTQLSMKQTSIFLAVLLKAIGPRRTPGTLIPEFTY